MEGFKKIVTNAVETVAEAIVRDSFIDYCQTHDIESTAAKKFLFNLNIQGKSGGKYEEFYFDTIDKTKVFLVDGMPELLEEYPEIAAHSSTVKAAEIYSDLIDEVKKSFEEVVSQITEIIKNQSVDAETYAKVVIEAKSSCVSVLAWEDILKKAVYMIGHDRYNAEWYDFTTDFIGFMTIQDENNVSLCTSASLVIEYVIVSFINLSDEIYEQLYLKDLLGVDDTKLPSTLKEEIVKMYENFRMPKIMSVRLMRERAPSVADPKHPGRKKNKELKRAENFEKAEFQWSKEKAFKARSRFLETQFQNIHDLVISENDDKSAETALRKCLIKGIGVHINDVYQLLAPYKFKAKKNVPIAVTQFADWDDKELFIEELLEERNKTKEYSPTLKNVLYVIILITSSDLNDFLKFL